MNLTNVHNLPDAFVSAVRNDPYVGGGDISVTKLIDSPQRRFLLNKFRESIVEDASEKLWVLLGQAVHTVLERANTSSLVEKRLFMHVNGWKLSGQFDRLHLESETLCDYKLTTVFKSEASIEWERQLNVLRLLVVENGYQVSKLEVFAMYRDWRRAEQLRDPNYPVISTKKIEIPMWTLEETRNYVQERIELHQRASRGEDVLCSDEERWYAGTTFALIKDGGKRAKRVAQTKEELGDVPDGYVIEERKGGYRRCESFCEVANFCSQKGSESNANISNGNTD